MDISILWVDDEWEAPSGLALIGLRSQFLSTLEDSGVSATVRTMTHGAILDDVLVGGHDLIILDHMLSYPRPEDTRPATSRDVLVRLERIRSAIPVVIVTGYIDKEPDLQLIKRHKNVHAIFEKAEDGINRLAAFVTDFTSRPPLTLVVISDLHAGYLAGRDGISWPTFRDSLVSDLNRLKERGRIDYLVISGDLAWTNQANDLPQASEALAMMQNALGLREAGTIHICPGNHDANYNDKVNPWGEFERLVRRIGAQHPGYLNRYYSFNMMAGVLDRFSDRRSMLALATDDSKSVLIACLNSCDVDVEARSVRPEIGNDQWDALERIVGTDSRSQVRIAVFHHPLLAAPGGDYEDERPLHDQGKALHLLAKMGFNIVIHGHAHFSAVYEHRIQVINRGGDEGRIVNLLVLACPTAGAEPNQGAPFRQYFVLELGHFDKLQSKRSVSLRSRVFSTVDRTWFDGDTVPTGSFFI